MRDEFDISALDNLITPSLPMKQAALSEDKMSNKYVQQRSSSVRVVFDLSASDNLVAAALSIS
jgi:hypothetical protein